MRSTGIPGRATDGSLPGPPKSGPLRAVTLRTGPGSSLASCPTRAFKLGVTYRLRSGRRQIHSLPGSPSSLTPPCGRVGLEPTTRYGRNVPYQEQPCQEGVDHPWCYCRPLYSDARERSRARSGFFGVSVGNRTHVTGFADRCIATLPRRHEKVNVRSGL